MNERENRPTGRVVYSHGPVIRTLTIISVIASLISGSAFLFSIFNLTDHIHDIQKERVIAATDTCMFLRDIIILSGKASDHKKQARQFIDSTPLRDCITYGKNVIKPKPRRIHHGSL